jgi:hypothetical protein
MHPAQLAHPRLDHRRHLMRAALRPVRPVGETVETGVLVAAQPGVHRLARHPPLLGDLDHRQPVDLDRQHCLIALFHLG